MVSSVPLFKLVILLNDTCTKLTFGLSDVFVFRCIQTKRQFGTRLKEHQKAVFLCKKENSALSEHTCLTNHTIGWDFSKIITINRRYHQGLCLGAWHINSAHAPLNRDDGGLLPDAYLHLVRK